jgi:hypothetical protein
MNRSSAWVRNPLLELPAIVERLQALPPEAQAALRVLALELRNIARAKADKAWRTCKAPMAVYWRGLAVYCVHFARLLKK